MKRRSMLEEKLDSEMREWVREEIDGLSGRKEQLEERIRLLLLPKDPNDEKNVIMEIRGGHRRGGSGPVCRRSVSDVYKIAEIQGWRTEDD